MKSYFLICMKVPALIYKGWALRGMVPWEDPENVNDFSVFKGYSFLDNSVLVQKSDDNSIIISDKFYDVFRHFTDEPYWANVCDVQIKVYVKEGVDCNEKQRNSFCEAFCYDYGMVDYFTTTNNDHIERDRSNNIYKFEYIKN